MKFKVTRKQVITAFGANRVIPAGLCDYTFLFSRVRSNAYTRGVYGWNADIYDFDTFAVARGYRPFGKATNKYLYMIMRHYDDLLRCAVRRGNIKEEYEKTLNKCLHVLKTYLTDRVN